MFMHKALDTDVLLLEPDVLLLEHTIVPTENYATAFLLTITVWHAQP